VVIKPKKKEEEKDAGKTEMSSEDEKTAGKRKREGAHEAEERRKPKRIKKLAYLQALLAACRPSAASGLISLNPTKKVKKLLKPVYEAKVITKEVYKSALEAVTEAVSASGAIEVPVSPCLGPLVWCGLLHCLLALGFGSVRLAGGWRRRPMHDMQHGAHQVQLLPRVHPDLPKVGCQGPRAARLPGSSRLP